MDQKVRKNLYTEHFRRALDVREQPRVFIDLVARSLGPKGARLRKWASVQNDAELMLRIDVILNENGGCCDEWQFLLTACGSPESSESSRSSNPSGRESIDDVRAIRRDDNTEEVSRQDVIQLVGSKVNKLLDDILKVIVSTILSGGKKFIVLQGDGMTGKTMLLQKLRDSLEEHGIQVIEYRHLITTGQVGSFTDTGIIYMDDADLENFNPASELELVKYFRSRKQSMIFICRNTSKIQNVMTACDAKLYKMPEYTDDETIKILHGTVIRGYIVSIKTCKQIISLLNAFGVDSKLSNGVDILRFLLFPRIQNDCRLGVEQSVVAEIDFSRDETESATKAVTGVGVAMKSSLADISEDLQQKIESRIVGQDHVLKTLLPFLTSISAGLTDPGRPSGVLLFYGPSGVGKTELSKVIADVIFDGTFHKEDMNTYSEKHSVSRFSGSPPGYIGYGEVPKIMEFIDSNTRGVLLLDEVEKAHETVMEHIMELLDTGMMLDTRGRKHDARGFLIIMTSNITCGKSENIVGFSSGKTRAKHLDPREEVRNTKVFKDEILNRIQSIVKFESLDGKDLKKIANLLLTDLEVRLESVGISKNSDDREKYLDLIVASYESSVGARGMKNYSETEIKNRIVETYLLVESKKTDTANGGTDGK